MTFEQPMWLLAVLLVPLVFIFLRRKGHARISDSALARPSMLGRGLRLVPETLLSLALLCALIALANPTVPDVPTTRTILGRDLVVAVDVSASMGFDFKGTLPELEKTPELDARVPETQRRTKPGETPIQLDAPKDGKLRRIDAAKRAILNFVRNRYVAKNGDRIGMVTFDNRPRIAWPLTHDLRMVYRQVQFIDRQLGLGTNFGNDPPGPIDLAISQFDELGQAKNKVIILVTDGEDELYGSTKYRLAKLMQEKGVRLYLVGVGETLSKNDVDIIKVAESVGGRVFRVEDGQSMQQCFATIDSLERSAVTYEQVEERKTVFFYFALAAAALLGLALVSEFFVINQ